MTTFNPDDPSTWPLKIPIIAHDVGHTNDRSTAVIGGHCPLRPNTPPVGVQQALELPLGLCGSELANTLAAIDQRYERNSLIVADLSNDPTYTETLFDTFGRRVIGVTIGRYGEGTTWETRRVRSGAVPVYQVGRTFLFDQLLAAFRECRVRLAPTADCKRAYEQLMALGVEQRESGKVYTCPPGQHDDLAISVAMLVWAARHLHLDAWTRPIFDAHRPKRKRQTYSKKAWT